MTEIRWDPAQKASMYRASLCGLPPATIADGVGAPEALVVEHLRRTPLAERLGYLLQQEADLVRRELNSGRPGRLAEVDLASASVADMYATARHQGTQSLTKAADAYARAVDRLRAALTAEQERVRDRTARQARIRQLSTTIEAHHAAITDARIEIAELEGRRPCPSS